jgi:DNA segregation ATPase FtsK/SpoIIIE-like protein
LTSKSTSKKSGSNAAVKAGRLVGSVAKLVGRLLVAAPAQFWFIVGIAAIAAVAYFVSGEDLETTLGWSIIPLGLWFVAMLYLSSFHRARLVAGWRWVVSSLGVALAISGGLGIFYVPTDVSLPIVSGETYGGDIGMAISRAPFDDDRFEVGVTENAVAWARVVALLIIAFAIATPKWAKRSAGELSGALVFVYVALVAGLQSLFRKFQNWRELRAEEKRLRKADLEEYEADQAAQAKIDAENEAVALAAVQSSGDTAVADEPADGENSVRDGVPDDSELDKFVERLPDDPATPITIAYPTPSEVEAAEEVAAPPPDYSAAYRYPWHLPDPDMLAIAKPGGITQEEIDTTSRRVEESLGQFGIDVSVDQVRQGPTVTMYGLSPGWKGRSEETAGQRVRVDTILNREKDIALALASPNLRFEAPVPGESVVGIEVPNAHPTQVTLRSVMGTPEWDSFVATAALPVPLGLGSGGEPVMADLARMPHTLVAGSTGSGKSVCMNAIITGLILTKTPLELRMIMIDPKRVELTPYQGIPHLYHPVIVEADRAVIVLKSLVDEMMGRFRQLEQAGVKNIAAYNEKMSQRMPYLVILVDELADLMLTAAGDVERLLVRLAQLGRATGVHLVVATQRPSVDVVTGLIKANFPSRISFAVMSQIDSRTILDSVGAEKLLGRGDMLYMPIDKPKPSRVQGAFLNDHEIEGVVSSWKSMGGPPLPELVVSFDDAGAENGTASSAVDGDSLFDQAATLAQSQKTLSVSLLQRRLRIGYPRAARLMDELEDEGIVGAGEPGKPRPVL